MPGLTVLGPLDTVSTMPQQSLYNGGRAKPGAPRRSSPSSWLPPVEWMEKIIRLDSVTDRSNQPVVEFVRPLLEAAGLTVRLHEVKEKGVRFFNVVAHNGSLSHPNLLALHTHLDTVAPGPLDLWTKGNPFSLTRTGKKVYGLGVADVKLDFLCKLYAVMKSEGRLPPLALVGSYGEERGLVGARKLLEAGWFRPRYALVGEPSLLEVIYAHKGHLVVTALLPSKYRGPAAGQTEFKGKAAHSSTPHLGDNAIEKGLLAVLKKKAGIVSITGGVGANTIPSRCTIAWTKEPTIESVALGRFLYGVMAFRKTLLKKKDPRFSPSTATISVNFVETTARGIEVTFDVRLLPSTPAEKVKKTLAQLIDQCGMTQIYFDHDPSLDGEKGSKLIRHASRALKAMGETPKLRTKASVTEAALYHEKGAETFVFGPGRSIGNVHKPNEFNELSQLAKATRFYFEMIQSFARKA